MRALKKNSSSEVSSLNNIFFLKIQKALWGLILLKATIFVGVRNGTIKLG